MAEAYTPDYVERCPDHPEALVRREFERTYVVLNGLPSGAGIEGRTVGYACAECSRVLSVLVSPTPASAVGEEAWGDYYEASASGGPGRVLPATPSGEEAEPAEQSFTSKTADRGEVAETNETPQGGAGAAVSPSTEEAASAGVAEYDKAVATRVRE